MRSLLADDVQRAQLARVLSGLDRRALRDVLWAVQAYQSVMAADGDAAADAWAKKMLRETGT